MKLKIKNKIKIALCPQCLCCGPDLDRDNIYPLVDYLPTIDITSVLRILKVSAVCRDNVNTSVYYLPKDNVYLPVY